MTPDGMTTQLLKDFAKKKLDEGLPTEFHYLDFANFLKELLLEKSFSIGEMRVIHNAHINFLLAGNEPSCTPNKGKGVQVFAPVAQSLSRYGFKCARCQQVINRGGNCGCL